MILLDKEEKIITNDIMLNKARLLLEYIWKLGKVSASKGTYGFFTQVIKGSYYKPWHVTHICTNMCGYH
jgi:hypothetical protein